jgi:hypothetical protein
MFSTLMFLTLQYHFLSITIFCFHMSHTEILFSQPFGPPTLQRAGWAHQIWTERINSEQNGRINSEWNGHDNSEQRVPNNGHHNRHHNKAPQRAFKAVGLHSQAGLLRGRSAKRGSGCILLVSHLALVDT